MKNCNTCGSDRIKIKPLNFNHKEFYSIDFHKIIDEILQDSLEIFCENCEALHFKLNKEVPSEYYNILNKSQKFYYPKHRLEYNIALNASILNNYNNVIDLGCGSGLFVNFLKNNGIKNITAIDFYISKKTENIIYQELNLNSNFKIPKSQLLTSFHVIEHIQNPLNFLKSIIKSKPKEILITTPNSDNYRNCYGVIDFMNYPPHHLTQFTKKSLEKLASNFDGYKYEVKYIERVNLFKQVLRLFNQNNNKSFKIFLPIFNFSNKKTNYNTLMLKLTRIDSFPA